MLPPPPPSRWSGRRPRLTLARTLARTRTPTRTPTPNPNPNHKQVVWAAGEAAQLEINLANHLDAEIAFEVVGLLTEPRDSLQLEPVRVLRGVELGVG